MNNIYFGFILFLCLLLLGGCRKERVRINGQVWMQENLNVDKFRNGDPIKEAKTQEEWVLAAESEQPAWCYFKNDPNNEEKYGKLYNWHAISDPRGLAPEGWRLPTLEEFEVLISRLGGKKEADKSLRSLHGWVDGNNGSNSSGFNGKPGGFRSSDGYFYSLNSIATWWTATQNDTYNAYHLKITSSIFNANLTSENKAAGSSVRCIKN